MTEPIPKSLQPVSRRLKQVPPAPSVVSTGRKQKPLAKGEVKRSGGEATALINDLLTKRDEGVLRFFHSSEGGPYVQVKRTTSAGEFHETWPLIRSGPFVQWIRWRHWEDKKQAMPAEVLGTAIDQLAAEAVLNGGTEDPCLRIARVEDRIYVDLGDPGRTIIEIDRDGWRSYPGTPPVPFLRPTSLGALPNPQGGGTLDDLWHVLHVDWELRPLVAMWMFGTFWPDEPQPLLVLHGEQGSGKSTMAKVIRSLVDPHPDPKKLLRALPTSQRDLAVFARNNATLAFDNVSDIDNWLSDALCRALDGAGFATRKNYSDDEEVVFGAPRPIIMTGIDQAVARPDLLDRALVVRVPRLHPEASRGEAEILMETAKVAPVVLGCLLTAISQSLGSSASVPPLLRTRMRNRALYQRTWRAQEVLGFAQGSLEEALFLSGRESAEASVEGDPLASLIYHWAKSLDELWEGTMTELFDQLVAYAARTGKRPPPGGASSLGRKFSRIAQSLRDRGMVVRDFRKGSESAKVHRLGFSDRSDA